MTVEAILSKKAWRIDAGGVVPVRETSGKQISEARRDDPARTLINYATVTEVRR